LNGQYSMAARVRTLARALRRARADARTRARILGPLSQSMDGRSAVLASDDADIVRRDPGFKES
jgi:hypothetical protein